MYIGYDYLIPALLGDGVQYCQHVVRARTLAAIEPYAIFLYSVRASFTGNSVINSGLTATQAGNWQVCRHSLSQMKFIVS